MNGADVGTYSGFKFSQLEMSKRNDLASRMLDLPILLLFVCRGCFIADHSCIPIFTFEGRDSLEVR